MQTNKLIARSNRTIKRINREFGQSIALLTADTPDDLLIKIDGLCAVYESQYDHAVKHGRPLSEDVQDRYVFA